MMAADPGVKWFHAPYEDAESWHGPFNSRESAIEDTKSGDSDICYVNTGTEWWPSFPCDWLLENSLDECPLEDWPRNMGDVVAALEAACIAAFKASVSSKAYEVNGTPERVELERKDRVRSPRGEL